MHLSAAQILAADDTKIEAVDVPEWGGTVHLRVMTGTARERYDAHREKTGNPTLALLAQTLCGPTGALLFDAAQLAALGEKDWRVLDRLAARAVELNRLRAADVDAAEGES